MDQSHAAYHVGVDARHHWISSCSNERHREGLKAENKGGGQVDSHLCCWQRLCPLGGKGATAWHMQATRFFPVFTAELAHCCSRGLPTLHKKKIKKINRSKGAAAIKATCNTHTDTNVVGGRGKEKRNVRLTHLAIFSPFFSALQSRSAPAFSDVTQPLSAAESSSRPAEDDQGGGRRESERRCSCESYRHLFCTSSVDRPADSTSLMQPRLWGQIGPASCPMSLRTNLHLVKDEARSPCVTWIGVNHLNNMFLGLSLVKRNRRPVMWLLHTNISEHQQINIRVSSRTRACQSEPRFICAVCVVWPTSLNLISLYTIVETYQYSATVPLAPQHCCDWDIQSSGILSVSFWTIRLC